MMYCYICKRPLLRAAATVTTADGNGSAGPTCARRAGLLPPRVERPRAIATRARRAGRKVSQQMELAGV